MIIIYVIYGLYSSIDRIVHSSTYNGNTTTEKCHNTKTNIHIHSKGLQSQISTMITIYSTCTQEHWIESQYASHVSITKSLLAITWLYGKTTIRDACNSADSGKTDSSHDNVNHA